MPSFIEQCYTEKIMRPAGANKTTRVRLNVSDVERPFGSIKLTAAAIRGALTLAVLCGLLIAPRPAQAQSYDVLYDFCATGTGNCLQTGAYPQGRLTPDGQGNFYGVTMGGGQYDSGTVFELSPEPPAGCPSGSNSGNGWCETPIYSFGPGPGGINPYLSYVISDSAGNLYGTAADGGEYFGGVVYELSLGGSGWTETVLYNFAGTPDGEYPYSGLVMDSSRNLYGITHNGGKNSNGCVFELSPSGGGWSEQKIYDIPAGDSIVAGLAIDAFGNLFGNTFFTVFELSPDGGTWNPSVLHTFGIGKDGIEAEGVPVLDGSGNIYGTTFGGGAHKGGTVYEVSPKPNKKWKEKVLYSFKDNSKDGGAAMAGVVLDANGNIYGTTTGGGKYTDGTVFELAVPVGKGSYKETTVWNFDGTTGDEPLGSLILDGGNLYGTAEKGGSGAGSGGDGVVFEMTP